LDYVAPGTVVVTHPWFENTTVTRQLPVRGSATQPRIRYSPGVVDLINGESFRISYTLNHNLTTNGFSVGVRSVELSGRIEASGMCTPL